jgi:DNA-directed RNA polymerase specialized sigma24 family protein
MFGERALKTPLYGKTEMPYGIAEMEHAVCMLTFDQRYVIVQWYCRHRRVGELARLVGVSRWRAMRLVKDAESEVHRQLEMLYELQDAVAYLK